MDIEEISKSRYVNMTKVQLMTHLHMRDTEREALVSVGMRMRGEINELQSRITWLESEVALLDRDPHDC